MFASDSSMTFVNLPCPSFLQPSARERLKNREEINTFTEPAREYSHRQGGWCPERKAKQTVLCKCRYHYRLAQILQVRVYTCELQHSKTNAHARLHAVSCWTEDFWTREQRWSRPGRVIKMVSFRRRGAKTLNLVSPSSGPLLTA